MKLERTQGWYNVLNSSGLILAQYRTLLEALDCINQLTA